MALIVAIVQMNNINTNLLSRNDDIQILEYCPNRFEI